MHSLAASPSHQLNFLIEARLKETNFNPWRREGLTFRSDDVDISIRPNSDDSSVNFGRPLICKVLATKPATQSQQAFVAALLNGKFLSYPEMPIELPYRERKQVQINRHGRIRSGFGLHFELYPKDVQELCDKVRNELETSLLRFVTLLRWVQLIDGPHWPFEFGPTLYWKVEGPEFHYVPPRTRSQTVPSPVGITWNDEDQKEIADLWDRGAQEPLAHELIREAISLLPSSPRGALLTAATALETGVKTHIARFAPDAQWILRNLPSPPVFKILRDYIPSLHARSERPPTWWPKLNSLFKRTQELAEYRNKLTHTGELVVDQRDVSSLIRMVVDILYILNVLEGHDWAKAHVSLETRKLLNWPAGRHKRYSVTMLARWPAPK